MNKLIVALAAAALALTAATYAPAQTGVKYVSPVTVGGSFDFIGGPQVSSVKANGGTVTCTGGGTPTVTNTNLTANSIVEWGLKTAGGTPAIPIMTTVTPGASFTVTCGGSDTSVWNYIILG